MADPVAHEGPATAGEADPVGGTNRPTPRSGRVDLPQRVRLVVLFGGQSAEHDVSRVTARNVLAALDPDRYDVHLIGIARNGRWLQLQGLPALDGAEAKALTVSGDHVDPIGHLRHTSDNVHGDALATVVLPLLHGPNGEDGTVQGLLEMSGLPYVGSGVLGSAVAMDKAVAKELCGHAGIPQAGWVALHEREVGPETLASAVERLGLPIFVKPANLGSSVGISKATNADDLATAVAVALEHDEYIVLEEAVNGREIELGVLGNEEPRVSLPGEIVSGAEFYDYEDKYVTGSAELVIPAELPAEAIEEAQRLALVAYRALRGADLGRVDFFYESPGRGLLLNEMNTMPGFTPASMYPRLWEASGVPYTELIDELVRLAIERHAHRGNRRR
ncbi:MAG: D-alanine--D-alanine ligase [Candidatus Microthrix sp.]|uniref:D-alanine--D-alanine ligase n=1 Tax=Candidatus Neomicrothrix subdominans TaxID=2954438 RepID=A0A936TGL5_9ACTN|nr:D-alanine--D-alanine ligase [Candidatus Microthrix subdominans]